jgi:hypothetical protein
VNADQLVCRDDRNRRRDLRTRGLTGLDFLEVGPGGRTLTVFFVNRPPEGLTARQLVIEGGRPGHRMTVTDVHVHRQRDQAVDECLLVTLDGRADASRYVLRLVGRKDIDPRFASLDFSFAVDCQAEVDCVPVPCPPRTLPEQEIDYLAKDYASFRRLILDRLALVMPDWRERHIPDLGIAVVELLAYVGDQLSYFQDAVATEAYLDTARQRTSMRRHGRLVDYALHDGCNARAWVHIETSQDLELPADTYFETADGVAYEPLLPAGARVQLRRAHNRIRFYTWGLRDCCLPTGTTAATLADDDAHPLELVPGDVLVFEEVLGPRTGHPGDAAAAHRHVVVLTAAREARDPVAAQPVVEIEWAADDALPFPLCLSVLGPNCQYLDDVSVARGNIVLSDHGLRADPEPLARTERPAAPARCEGEDRPADPIAVRASFTVLLDRAPVTFAQPVRLTQRVPAVRPLGPYAAASRRASARALISQDPHCAVPSVELHEVQAPGDTTVVWTARQDLLRSGPADRHFVVETDEQGRAAVRLGDGVLGARPAADSTITAHYRVGSGPAGNVSAEAISRIVAPPGQLDGVTLRARNPLPAVGGTAPEHLALAKLAIPFAFRRELRRAVTGEDYAKVAERDPRVQRAHGALRWSGSWYEAQVAVDRLGSGDPGQPLLDEVAAALEPFRRIGHDLRVTTAVQVPLDIALSVCVKPHYLRGHIRSALLEVLSNRTFSGGRRGFFHPDVLTFGSAIYLSRLVAMVQAVDGVESVAVTTFKRLFAPTQGELLSGVIRLGPGEVPRLDNDPAALERGRLTLDMRGGR